VDPEVPSITIPPVRVVWIAVWIVVWIVIVGGGGGGCWCDVLSSFDTTESAIPPFVITPPSPFE